MKRLITLSISIFLFVVFHINRVYSIGGCILTVNCDPNLCDMAIKRCVVPNAEDWNGYNVTATSINSGTVIGGTMNTSDGSMYFEIDQNGQYQFNAYSDQCGPQSTSVDIDMLSLNHTIPTLCIGMNGDRISINITSGLKNLYTTKYMTINHGQEVTLAGVNATSGSGPSSYNGVTTVDIRLSNDNGATFQTCSYSYPEPIRPLIPRLAIFQPMCGSTADGNIQVVNQRDGYGAYELYYGGIPHSNGTSIPVADNGTAYQVQIEGCTLDEYFPQNAYGVIYHDQPIVGFTTAPIQGCNNTHGYIKPMLYSKESTVLDPPIDAYVNVGDYVIPIGQEIIIPYGVYKVYYPNCNGISSIYEFGPRSIPLTYKVSTPTVPSCSNPNQTVTLQYDGGNYTDLTIESRLHGVLVPNPSNQFVMGYPDTITISSKCYSGSVIIKSKVITPSVTYFADRQDCSGNVTVVIQNYQSFDLLSVTGFGDTAPIIQTLSNRGIISGLWFGNYNLTYKEVGVNCELKSMIITLVPDLSIPQPPDNVEFQVTGFVPRTSCSSGSATGQVHVVWNGLVSTSQVGFSASGPTSKTTVPFNHSKCPHLTKSYDFVAGQYGYPTQATVSMITQAKCKQSLALIHINSSDIIRSVYVNGTLVNGTAGQYYVPWGPINININYDSCNQVVQFNSDILDNNYTIQYLIKPQLISDCNVPSGIIEILNYTQFNNVSIDGQINGNGTWVVGSGDKTINFDHNYCGVGQISVNVPISPVEFSLNVIQPSSCLDRNQGDSKLSFGVKNQSSIIITNVKEHQDSTSTSVFKSSTKTLYGLRGGTQSLDLYSGNYCAWTNVNFTVPTLSVGNLVKTTIQSYPIDPINTGLVLLERVPNNINLSITKMDIVEGDGIFSWDYTRISGFDYLNSPNDSFTIDVEYNQYCHQYLVVNMTNPTPLNSTLQYIIKPFGGCGSNLVNIQFLNVKNQFLVNVTGYGQVNIDSGSITVPAGLVYNVKFESIHSLANGSMRIDTGPYMVSNSNPIKPVLTIYNETCPGSNDGQLIVANVSVTSNTFILTRMVYGGFKPLSIVNGLTVQFNNLEAGLYQLEIVSTNNSMCYYQYPFTISSTEPVLTIESTHFCSPSIGSITTFKVSGDRQYQYQASMGSLTTTNNKFQGVNSGVHLLSVNITSPAICPRMLFRYVNIPVESNFVQVSIGSNDKCLDKKNVNSGVITVYSNLDQMNSENQFILYKVGGQQQLATLPVLNIQDGFKGLNSGVYQVVAVDKVTGCRITSNTIELSACEPPVSSSFKLKPVATLLFIIISIILLL